MKLYDPITHSSQLPIENDPESPTLDFKEGFGEHSSEKERICKSVAAFANSLGGTLILGAEAKRTERLIRYVGVKDANSQQKRLQHITNEYLSPRWTIHPIELESNAGPVIVVNVEPSATAIAYRVPGDDDLWKVPLRTGRETSFLSFEEVERMISPVRRALILLSRVPPDSWIVLDHALPREQLGAERSRSGGRISAVNMRGDESDSWQFKGIDEEAVVLHLHHEGSVVPIHIPLASIEAVWRDPGADRFVISTRSWLYRRQNGFAVAMGQFI